MPASDDEFLARLADGNPELIERVIGRQVENIAESGLDPRIHALVRIASLISVGASDDEIAGVLVAVGPTAGMPRVVAAAPHLAKALSS